MSLGASAKDGDLTDKVNAYTSEDGDSSVRQRATKGSIRSSLSKLTGVDVGNSYSGRVD